MTLPGLNAQCESVFHLKYNKKNIVIKVKTLDILCNGSNIGKYYQDKMISNGAKSVEFFITDLGVGSETVLDVHWMLEFSDVSWPVHLVAVYNGRTDVASILNWVDTIADNIHTYENYVMSSPKYWA